MPSVANQDSAAADQVVPTRFVALLEALVVAVVDLEVAIPLGFCLSDCVAAPSVSSLAGLDGACQGDLVVEVLYCWVLT